jgi:HSP20 family protein
MARTERKRNDDINDIFSTFDEEFEEMKAHMDRMMEQMMNGPASFDTEPRVYGVSVHIGPDGQPHVQEYGNFNQPVPEPEAAPHTREPLMDIVEEKDKVRVIMELPGVRNDDISVCADTVWLDIAVDTENRKFSKRIELPSPVRADSAASSYKNGVLEITLDREPPKRRKKKTIVD